MNKRVVYIAVLAFVILASVLAVKIIYQRIQHSKLVALENAFLKSLSLLKIDSSQYVLSEAEAPFVILYFNSSCEHCQQQAEVIQKELSLFKNVTLIFISTETLKDIRNFVVRYKLHNLDRVEVLKINSNDLYKYFGTISTPHIYLYNQERRLVKEFNGETKPATILKYL